MSRYSAHGTQLQIGDGASPEVFTTIAQVRDIQGPGLSTNIIDGTDHDSGGAKSKVAGVRDGGQLTLDIAYDPAHGTHNAATGLLRDWKNGTLRNFKLVFPDAGNTAWSIAGLVQGFQPTAPVDDLLTAAVTLEVSGDPTLA